MKLSTFLQSVFTATLLAASPVQAASYTSGHADLGVAYEGGAFNFHFHGEGAVIDGTEVSDQEYDPADILIVAENSHVVLPEGFNLPALGKVGGDTIWLLPWTQEEGLPFLGLASEELNPSDWVGGITFTLTGITAPSLNGEFALWRYDSFGEPQVDVSTLAGPNSVTTITGSHDHFNWGFTEPGSWDLELTVTGNHVTDGLVTATRTFHFEIVPEPSAALLGAMGMLGLLVRRRR